MRTEASRRHAAGDVYKRQGLVIGIMQGMVIEADPAPKWALSGVHHLLEVLVAGVVLWFVFVRRRSLPFSLLWRMILAFTATGVLALPLFGRLLSGWALVVIGVAQTLVVMLLWACLLYTSLRPPHQGRQRLWGKRNHRRRR